MSLIKKSGMRLAAVAAAVGLALGGVLMASPAYASPEDPAPTSLSLPSPIAGTTQTISGTGEPGGTIFLWYNSGGGLSNHLSNKDDRVFAQIDDDGNFSFPVNVGNAPGETFYYTYYTYAEDAAMVEAAFNGTQVQGLTALFPDSTRFSTIRNQETDESEEPNTEPNPSEPEPEPNPSEPTMPGGDDEAAVQLPIPPTATSTPEGPQNRAEELTVVTETELTVSPLVEQLNTEQAEIPATITPISSVTTSLSASQPASPLVASLGGAAATLGAAAVATNLLLRRRGI